MFDILVTFNSGTYIAGDLCMNRSKVTFYYLRTWFLMDVVASFPYDLVFQMDTSATAAA
jgi:hyperpolarization activated cyclic nucleotide-gated potassium channel 2